MSRHWHPVPKSIQKLAAGLLPTRKVCFLTRSTMSWRPMKKLSVSTSGWACSGVFAGLQMRRRHSTECITSRILGGLGARSSLARKPVAQCIMSLCDSVRNNEL